MVFECIASNMSVMQIMSLSAAVLKILEKQHCNSNNTATQHYKIKVMIQAQGPSMISYMLASSINYMYHSSRETRQTASKQEEVSLAAPHQNGCGIK